MYEQWEVFTDLHENIQRPELNENIDVWAGRGDIHGLQAHYRYLVWKNVNSLFAIKPELEYGSIDNLGHTFEIKFKFYVSKFPDQGKVSMKNQDKESYSEIINMFR